MPYDIPAGQSVLLVKRAAYERAGITRRSIDERLNLTDEEFRVDGPLVIIGPVPDDAGVRDLIADLEATGLSYFDDFFELSGNWPPWVRLSVSGR